MATHPLTPYGNGKENMQDGSAAAQQCRYYEVDNIFEYMVETYINGNHSTFSELYHELNKETRQDFVEFLFNEVNPQYLREIIKQML